MSTDANTNTVCNNGFQGKKRKRGSSRSILKEIRNNSKNKDVNNEEQENGIDLSLSLAPPRRGGEGGGDEWKITKELTRSDVVSRQNRLLIARDEGQRHIMNYLGNDEQHKVYDRGCPITVVDIDTQDELKLKFRYWKSTKSYAINGKWHKLVVTRRGLEKEVGSKLATVGLRWDDDNKKLIFSVLKD
ncbi:putative B3 domain-containing protein At1g78640 [Silene latifolia]|uniref:putative B3 domain-containing protein At1g78640 n=1 Tax=Silene latifolia TaxID=37657 RepID=UPI003D77AE1B